MSYSIVQESKSFHTLKQHKKLFRYLLPFGQIYTVKLVLDDTGHKENVNIICVKVSFTQFSTCIWDFISIIFSNSRIN